MAILNQEAIIMLAKTVKGMDERISIDRHQMDKEKIIAEAKETIVHQITKGNISLHLMIDLMIFLM